MIDCSHLRADSRVADVMDRWPQTLLVFLHRRTACVGCPMAPFCTLDEVAHAYHLDIDSLLDELEQATLQPPFNQGETQ
ncbi:MAG: hypothetical protein U9R25_12135 [Chloroflexota bacterium]|nr:hypothetical protein [Chloroflexota bacterium]